MGVVVQFPAPPVICLRQDTEPQITSPSGREQLPHLCMIVFEEKQCESRLKPPHGRKVLRKCKLFSVDKSFRVFVVDNKKVIEEM